jgi:hypothetical protein
MADVEMIYEHSRACDVHAEATREYGPVVWCVNRAEYLGPGMYAAQPYPRDGGWGLPYVLVGPSRPALRALLPPGLKRRAPMSEDPESSLEWWYEP